ncbi:MAG: MotA/TolQ/ExbB proton channel family protein [Firmicutes bacterium]|nr:MotA/TolQ/ExbB proton channel family protein [Bacillota bacterium]
MRWIIQGGIFMLPLLICSVLMVAISLERFWFFTKVMKTPLIDQTRPAEVMKNLRRYLPALHTIITISPMLGLLGTVTGLMRCFNLLGKQATVYDPVEMSLGISEALITTAAGLIITVIATVFYNYFSARMDSYFYDYELALGEASADESNG